MLAGKITWTPFYVNCVRALFATMSLLSWLLYSYIIRPKIERARDTTAILVPPPPTPFATATPAAKDYSPTTYHAQPVKASNFSSRRCFFLRGFSSPRIYIYIIYICFANILCSELAQCTQKASQALVSAVIVGPSRFCGAQLITCNESAVCVAELRPGNLIVAQCSAIPMTRCITLLFQTESPVAAPVRDGGCQHV